MIDLDIHRAKDVQSKVDIAVLTHNNINMTKDFLRAVFDNSDVPFHLVVMDNGSTDETQSLLMETREDHLSSMTVILADENTGVISGRNIVASFCDSDIVCFLDNDQIPHMGWLSNHIEAMDGIDVIGVEAWTMNKKFYPSGKIHKAGRGFHYVGCGGMAIRSAVIDKIGLFDEQFNPAFFEDPDFCYDKDTCVLTRNGIKPFPDVSLDDELLTLSDKGIQEYQKPNRLIRKFESHLLHFKCQQVDICCSGDQYLLVGYKRPSYKNIDKGCYREPDFIKAKDISSKLRPRHCRYFIEKSKGMWEGVSSPIIVGKKEYDPVLFAEFLG